jgi:ligand-binding sensor domain-containing protein/DNA-binding CsgD family transcriptional regulator
MALVFKTQSQDIALHTTPLSTFFESSVYQGGIQNWRFDQDSSNILYVANSFGLLEFDGETWSRYIVPNSTKTRAIYIDSSNTIFVGSQGQLGFFKLQEDGLQFTSLLSKLPKETASIDEVWNIYELKGNIHFQTSNGLFRLEDSLLVNLFPANNITGSFLLEKQIIIQQEDNDLFLWKDESLFPLLNKDKHKPGKVTSAVQLDNGLLLFCENGQVFEVNSMYEITEKKSLSSLFAIPLINVAIRLASGNIAVGTQNDGLFILNKEYQVTRHMTKKQGLDHRTVYSLYQDQFNNLWVGLNNGISYIELSSPLSLINEEAGLEGTGHTALMHKDKLYLGTNNGLFSQIKSNNHSQYEIISGTEGIVYGLTIAGRDLLMTHHSGAFRINSDQVNHFFKENGAWKLMSTRKANKLIGGTYHGLSIFDKTDESWKAIWSTDDFKESSRILEWENDTVLWMTHGYKGAFRITFNSDISKLREVRQYGEKDGFPSNLLISVYKLNDRLIFTSESGIFEFNPNSNRFQINEFLTELLGKQHVSKITPLDNGNILFIAQDELGILQEQAFGKYSKVVNIFKRINKYLSNDLENINVIDAENILIGAKEGFIHFDPTSTFIGEQSYNTLLRSITISHNDLPVRKVPPSFFNKIQLAKIHGLKFEFSAPYFDGFDDIQFSYRLMPYEKEWSEWTDANTKEYTNLPAGKYTFEVKAKNIYGLEGKKAATTFNIKNVWYKTSLAYAIYTSLALLVFGFVSYLQDRKYRSEKLKLSESKESALKEKEKELTDLSEKSKREIQDLKNQKLKSEIHHKNNQLASVTMHLINKNEFVQEVRKRIDQMLQEKSTSTEELKKIIKTIDKNHSEDDSWDQFAHHFDQVHGDFLKKLVNDVDKLTPQETKLAAYLRMNMSSKEIANLMGISVRGVELARYRLRKKLRLDRDQNLNDYLMNL